MANIKHLKDQEGYLMLDNRNAPVPDEIVVAQGMPVGSGRGMKEYATYTCSHCQRIVVLNPERQRLRAYCGGCNHRICDGCATIKAQTGVCKTFEQVIDETLNRSSIFTGA
jgi:hypothetical protein